MIELKEAAEIYVNEKRAAAKEKDTVRNLIKRNLAEKLGSDWMLPETEGERRRWNSSDKYIQMLAIQDTAIEIVQSDSTNKEKTTERLRDFMEWLNKEYKLKMDIDASLPRVIAGQLERQLDLLKALHTPRTMAELEEQYRTSSRTLRKDLGELESGKELLGQRIQIERIKGREIKYKTSVHPVFLALNLTEATALVIGLKELGRDRVTEEIFTHLSDTIFTQLSPYAKEKVKEAGRMQGIEFEEHPVEKGYRREDRMKEINLENALLYALKSREECLIVYREHQEIKQVEGKVVHLGFEDNLICIRSRKHLETVIPMENIIKAEQVYK